jgi:hypothetical protein
MPDVVRVSKKKMTIRGNPRPSLQAYHEAANYVSDHLLKKVIRPESLVGFTVTGVWL